MASALFDAIPTLELLPLVVMSSVSFFMSILGTFGAWSHAKNELEDHVCTIDTQAWIASNKECFTCKGPCSGVCTNGCIPFNCGSCGATKFFLIVGFLVAIVAFVCMLNAMVKLPILAALKDMPQIPTASRAAAVSRLSVSALSFVVLCIFQEPQPSETAGLAAHFRRGYGYHFNWINWLFSLALGVLASKAAFLIPAGGVSMPRESFEPGATGTADTPYTAMSPDDEALL